MTKNDYNEVNNLNESKGFEESFEPTNLDESLKSTSLEESFEPTNLDESLESTDLVEVDESAFDASDSWNESTETVGDKVNKGLRKLNPKYKTKAERQAERDALSELETEDYVPEEHDPVYEVYVDKKIYANNYVMGAVFGLLGIIMFPYSKTATALLVFYGMGVAWMAWQGIRTKVSVDHNTFTIEGVKYPGTYTFDQVDKIIYTYNKKDQRRYWLYIDGKRIGEVPPGAIHSRWLYDDMMAYGVPGGWYNKL